MTVNDKLTRRACEALLVEAENFDLHLGNKRANMLRRALGIPEVIYSDFYQDLLKQTGPLL